MSALRAVLATLLFVGLGACSPGDALERLRPAPRTAHDRYAEALRDAGLDSTALGQEWLAASDSALRSPLSAALPAREVGVYTRDEARAVAYRFTLRDGERVRATLSAVGLRARIYLDLFELTGDTLAANAPGNDDGRDTPFRHRATADTVAATDSAVTTIALEYEARRNGDVVLRLQPELLRAGRYTLEIRTEPTLAFPVDGRGNSAIQSLYGAVRDGGRRDHHGIDIFAPRGTPVLAVTDGVVRSTSPNNLGGNVIWLSDGARGQTVYYAHLDRQIVTAGQRVDRGDTIGFVGNTGNARSTPPHLHFGIYRRGAGPIDPLHHVRLVSAALPAVTVTEHPLGRFDTLTTARELLAAPVASARPLGRVSAHTRIRVMAANGRWYRVQLEDGRTGYLAGAALNAAARRSG